MAVDLADLRAQVRELEAAERAQQETVAALLTLIPGSDAPTKIAAITPHAKLNDSERACLGSVLAPMIPFMDFLRFLEAHERSTNPRDPEMRNGLGWVHQFLIEKTGNLWAIGPASVYPRAPGGKRIGADITLPSFALALVAVDAIITAASARAWLRWCDTCAGSGELPQGGTCPTCGGVGHF